jgi:hypothetical protein
LRLQFLRGRVSLRDQEPPDGRVERLLDRSARDRAPRSPGPARQ